MGRPPIGDKAMTGLERLHRFRQRKAAETKPETKPEAGEADALKRENAALRAQVATLARERDGAFADARGAISVGADAAAAIGKRDREIDGLKAKLAKAEEKLADGPGAVAEAERKLKAARTRIRNAEAAARGNPAAISKRDWRKLQHVIHPDSGKAATERQRTEAAQVFNALKLRVRDDPR